MPLPSKILDSQLLALHGEGQNTVEIGRTVGLTRSRISQRLRLLGIVGRHSRLKHPLVALAQYPQLLDPMWLQAQIERSLQEVADELGCSMKLVSVAYRQAEIARQPARGAQRRSNAQRLAENIRKFLPLALALREHMEAGHTYEETARAFSLGSKFSVIYALKRAGLSLKIGRGHSLKQRAVA